MHVWTLASVFEACAREHPERILIVAGNRSLTYGAVDAQSSALAAALAELGIEKGDRIAINMPNVPEWVVSLIAAAKLGATVVPVDPRLRQHELKYQLRHAEVSAVITIERFRGVDYLQIFESLIAEVPALHYVVTVGDEDLWYDDRIFQFEDLVSSGSGRSYPVVEQDPTADLALLYTSGVTGKPKGVRLSHRSIVECAYHAGRSLNTVPEDRALCPVPLFAIFGFTVVVGAIVSGTSIVMQEVFDAEESLRLIESQQVTLLHGVPAVYQLLMRSEGFTAARVSSVRTGVIAGGPVPEDLIRRVRRWCDVQIAYGLTETGPTVSVTTFDDPADKRLGTVGRALPGVEVRSVDPVTGEALPAPSEGIIAVRGWNVMSGYARMPGETGRSFTHEGFFLTGDLGFVDQAGYIHVVGRSGEVILRGGYRVYPREVEEPLHAHPAVDDVCVIGVPNEILGELICACIVPVEGAVITGEEIKDFARATMAAHKVPDIVRFFHSFPMTGSGKTKRRELERTLALEHTATTGSS